MSLLTVIADVLQVVYGAALVLLLLMAIGAWRKGQEVSTVQLSRDLASCRKECDRRLNEHDGRLDRQAREFARNDVVTVELRNIGERLERIEQALLPPRTVEG